MIIGLTGYKGTGKTTAAEYLQDEYGFKRLNFKDALIDELLEKFPTLLEKIADTYQMNVKELFTIKPPLMRALMQEFGTDVRRADNPDYWVEKWSIAAAKEGGNIVVDDVRFFNELAALGDNGGVLIRITRPDVTSGGEHQSETEQEKFIEDFTIDGVPGSHKEIYHQLDVIIQTLKSNTD